MENEIKINKVYKSIDTKYKVVEKKCDNKTCYHIRLKPKRFSFMYGWGELPIHYNLDEIQITIPNLLEFDKHMLEIEAKEKA